MSTTSVRTLQNFIDGAFADAASGRDRGGPQPGDRRGDRPGAAVGRRGRRPRGGGGQARVRVLGHDDARRALAGAAALRRRRRGARRRARAARGRERRQAAGRRARSDEIPFMVDNLRFFAGAARCMEGKAAGEYVEGYTSMIRREPIGVIGQIAPWNYPMMMAIWKIGPALATGNTVVLKPAETTPVTTLRLAELAADFLPAGVLNVITGHGDPAGSTLVTHPDVDMVSLTGSPGHRQVDRQGGRGHAQARAPRARRQGAGRGLRRRRHGDRDGDDRRHRLLQRRPGLHRRQPRARLREGLRRRRRRPGRAGQGTGRSATRCRPTRRSGR